MYLTVAQLIEKLESVTNKNLPVVAVRNLGESAYYVTGMEEDSGKEYEENPLVIWDDKGDESTEVAECVCLFI